MRTTETIEVSHTSTVSGCSKFIFSTFLYFALWMASLAKRTRRDSPASVLMPNLS